MTCHNCRTEWKRKGYEHKGNQRYQSLQSKTFMDTRENQLDGMTIGIDRPEKILKLLREGKFCRVHQSLRITRWLPGSPTTY